MVRKNGTRVTVSVGAVTFVQPPPSVDEMIKRADDLMYEVKHSGKNRVAQGVYPPQNGATQPPAMAG